MIEVEGEMKRVYYGRGRNVTRNDGIETIQIDWR